MSDDPIGHEAAPAARPFSGPAHSKPLKTTDPALQEIEREVVEQLRSCYDPEIPVNIYELGLIYDIDVTPEGKVGIRMTLTSPMCPVAETLPPEVEAKARAVAGVSDVKLDLVWDPPWSPSMMSEAARLELNFE